MSIYTPRVDGLRVIWAGSVGLNNLRLENANGFKNYFPYHVRTYLQKKKSQTKYLKLLNDKKPQKKTIFLKVP